MKESESQWDVLPRAPPLRGLNESFGATPATDSLPEKAVSFFPHPFLRTHLHWS